VPAAVHRQVFKEYHINCGKQCGQLYEVDHLVSLEIGGANDLANLWPQPYSHPGAHEKDVLENKLHKMICDGDITPNVAQLIITADWWKAYKKYVSKKDVKLPR